MRGIKGLSADPMKTLIQGCLGTGQETMNWTSSAPWANPVSVVKGALMTYSQYERCHMFHVCHDCQSEMAHVWKVLILQCLLAK
jgi:hypothetical protein